MLGDQYPIRRVVGPPEMSLLIREHLDVWEAFNLELHRDWNLF
jgi:hypothetical protein